MNRKSIGYVDKSDLKKYHEEIDKMIDDEVLDNLSLDELATRLAEILKTAGKAVFTTQDKKNKRKWKYGSLRVLSRKRKEAFKKYQRKVRQKENKKIKKQKIDKELLEEIKLAKDDLDDFQSRLEKKILEIKEKSRKKAR